MYVGMTVMCNFSSKARLFIRNLQFRHCQVVFVSSFPLEAYTESFIGHTVCICAHRLNKFVFTFSFKECLVAKYSLHLESV